MILIVCLDENKGMLFNRRRQSRDRAVVEDMIKISQGTVLWIAPYSAGLFEKEIPRLRIEEDCLEKAGAGEFCFAEELPESYGFAGVEKLVVYLVEPQISLRQNISGELGRFYPGGDQGISRDFP